MNQSVHEYINESKSDRDKYYNSSVNQFEYNALKNMLRDEEKWQEASNYFLKILEDYQTMLRDQIRLNRLVVRDILSNIAKGNIILDDTKSSIEVKNQDLLRPEIVFHTLNYLQSNENFILSLNEADLEYAWHLVSSSSNITSALNEAELTLTQKTLREYLGKPISLLDAQNFIDNDGKDLRKNTSKESFLMAAYASRLSYSLAYAYYFQTMTDRNDLGTNPLESSMADFDERIKNINEAM